MKISEHWEQESLERKEYLAIKMQEIFNITKDTTEKEYSEKVNNFISDTDETLKEFTDVNIKISKKLESLTTDEMNIYFYIKGELNKTGLIKKSFEIIGKLEEFEKVIYTKPHKFSSVRTSYNTEYMASNYFLYKSREVRQEKYLIKGNIQFITRDRKTGKFIKYSGA